jgi:hypothetical protein
MVRPLQATYWLLSALIAIGFFVTSGFYGWAAILLWTVLVLPMAIQVRRAAKATTSSWPPRPILGAWLAALVTSFAAGLIPEVLSPNSVPSLKWALGGLGWALAGLGWVSVLLSSIVVCWATYDRTVGAGAA